MESDLLASAAGSFAGAVSVMAPLALSLRAKLPTMLRNALALEAHGAVEAHELRCENCRLAPPAGSARGV